MELIRIIESDGNRVVSARDLHKFLRSGREFTTWIKKRIEDYDFKEDVDYTKTSVTLSQGGRLKEYAITVDMAKELAMIEGNEQGRKARKYFIEVEKKFKQNIIDSKPLSQLELMKNSIEILIKQDQRLNRLEQKFETLEKETKPKTDFYDKVLSSNELLAISQIASELGLKGQMLNQDLKARGILYKQGKIWYLTKNYLNHDLARYATFIDASGESRSHLKWTQKGREFILNLFKEGIDPYKNLETKEIKISVNISANSTESESYYGLAVCPNCGANFKKNTHNHKWCKELCRLEYYEKKTGKDLSRFKK